MAKKPAKKSPDGKSAGKGGGGRTVTVPAALDPVRFGVMLATVIAGPPLWTLYDAGNMDLTTALLHGGLVAVGCGIGIGGINRLIADYRVQADRERRIQQMMDAIEGVVHEGLPIPAPHVSRTAPGSERRP